MNPLSLSRGSKITNTVKNDQELIRNHPIEGLEKILKESLTFKTNNRDTSITEPINSLLPLAEDRVLAQLVRKDKLSLPVSIQPKDHLKALDKFIKENQAKISLIKYNKKISKGSVHGTTLTHTFINSDTVNNISCFTSSPYGMEGNDATGSKNILSTKNKNKNKNINQNYYPTTSEYGKMNVINNIPHIPSENSSISYLSTQLKKVSTYPVTNVASVVKDIENIRNFTLDNNISTFKTIIKPKSFYSYKEFNDFIYKSKTPDFKELPGPVIKDFTTSFKNLLSPRLKALLNLDSSIKNTELSAISKEINEVEKNYLISEIKNKIDILKDYNIYKQIKSNLISNYFLNKVLINEIKSLDEYKYMLKFKLILLPYTYKLFLFSYKFILYFLLKKTNKQQAISQLLKGYSSDNLISTHPRFNQVVKNKKFKINISDIKSIVYNSSGNRRGGSFYNLKRKGKYISAFSLIPRVCAYNIKNVKDLKNPFFIKFFQNILKEYFNSWLHNTTGYYFNKKKKLHSSLINRSKGKNRINKNYIFKINSSRSRHLYPSLKVLLQNMSDPLTRDKIKFPIEKYTLNTNDGLGEFMKEGVLIKEKYLINIKNNRIKMYYNWMNMIQFSYFFNTLKHLGTRALSSYGKESEKKKLNHKKLYYSNSINSINYSVNLNSSNSISKYVEKVYNINTKLNKIYYLLNNKYYLNYKFFPTNKKVTLKIKKWNVIKFIQKNNNLRNIFYLQKLNRLKITKNLINNLSIFNTEYLKDSKHLFESINSSVNLQSNNRKPEVYKEQSGEIIKFTNLKENTDFINIQQAPAKAPVKARSAKIKIIQKIKILQKIKLLIYLSLSRIQLKQHKINKSNLLTSHPTLKIEKVVPTLCISEDNSHFLSKSEDNVNFSISLAPRLNMSNPFLNKNNKPQSLNLINNTTFLKFGKNFNFNLLSNLKLYQQINLENKNTYLTGLRKFLYKYNLISHIGQSQAIVFNFNKNIKRINSLDSLDFTGSLIKANMSVFLKYFFNLLGGALISKPVYTYTNKKIIIQLSYFFNKNTYFFNDSEKSRLYYLLCKNTQTPDKSIMLNDYDNKGDITSRSPSRNGGSVGHVEEHNISTYDIYNNIPKWVFLRKKRSILASIFLKKNGLSNIVGRNQINNNILSLFKKEINALTLMLENFFNIPIQLEITRLYYPFFESNILAQIIGLNGKKHKFEKIVKNLFPKFKIRNPNANASFLSIDLSPKLNNSLSSYLSGIRIRVAGRFYKHKIIPKKTVSIIQRGSLARGVISFVDSSRYTNKSKRGSFSITVSVSHIF